MTPEDRRASLIVATVPLLRSFGVDVSTRQIAEAAGVAEGTIFGVFPDKGSLVRAALVRALDPGDTLAAIAAIDLATDLRARLAAAADLLIRRFDANADLMAAARGMAVSPEATPELHEQLIRSRSLLTDSLIPVIEPDAARLRRSPATVSRMLTLLVLGATQGMFGGTERMTGAEMVGVLLDGLLKPTDDLTDRGGPVPC
jgi:AcrR family transcriptional regulator